MHASQHARPFAHEKKIVSDIQKHAWSENRKDLQRMGKREIHEPGRQLQARLLAQVTTGNRREYAAIPSNPQVRNRITLRMKLPMCTSDLALSLKKNSSPKHLLDKREAKSVFIFYLLKERLRFLLKERCRRVLPISAISLALLHAQNWKAAQRCPTLPEAVFPPATPREQTRFQSVL